MPGRIGPVPVAVTRKACRGKVYESHCLKRTCLEGKKVRHRRPGSVSRPEMGFRLRHACGLLDFMWSVLSTLAGLESGRHECNEACYSSDCVSLQLYSLRVAKHTGQHNA
ncbi:MAG: hypothetical protein QG577_2905 [Thermodesulfobacteriota bacterium]|nr:hypothetical protein [Thermodesulfobacteriota bacterium]